jgi:hypothetical protein
MLGGHGEASRAPVEPPSAPTMPMQVLIDQPSTMLVGRF